MWINPKGCGAEGFQRTIGKPFGRARRRENPLQEAVTYCKENALDAKKNRVPVHFYCTKKEKPLMQLPLIFAYFSMDSSQESNGLMPSRPATVGATFARPKPWPSFNS